MDGDGGADFGQDGFGHGDHHGGFGFDGMAFGPDADHSHGGWAENSVQQPFGDLLGGLETGLGYVTDPHEGGTMPGVDSLGHNNSIAELTATAIAVELALEHDGVNGLSDFTVGHMHDVPALQGVCHAGHADGDEGRKVNLPGKKRTRTAIEVLGWPHGKCSPMEQVEKLAAQVGLTRVKLAGTHNMKDVDRRVDRLLSNTPFGNDSDPVNRSNGWYRQVTGQTHVWRQYWQLQPMKWIWPLSLLFNTPFEKWRTFLVISGTTWHYDQPDDYETRVSFSVSSLPFAERGVWTYRFDHIKQHRACAERIAKALLPYLTAQKVGARSLDVRKKLSAEDVEPVKPIPLPPPAPLPNHGGGGFTPVDHAPPAAEGADARPDWVEETPS